MKSGKLKVFFFGMVSCLTCYCADDAIANRSNLPVRLLPLQMSGYQLAIKSLPPDNQRETVIAYKYGAKIEFDVSTNRALSSITPVQKANRVFAVLWEVFEIGDESGHRGWRLADVGELILSTNQTQQVELTWQSLLAADEPSRMEKSQVSIIRMTEWMGNLLLEVNMPVSKEGYTTTYESRSTTYDIQRKEFNPPISSFCQIAESVLTEKGKVPIQ